MQGKLCTCKSFSNFRKASAAWRWAWSGLSELDLTGLVFDVDLTGVQVWVAVCV